MFNNSLPLFSLRILYFFLSYFGDYYPLLIYISEHPPNDIKSNKKFVIMRAHFIIHIGLTIHEGY